MTTYTLSDLATRVLRDLGLVAADETPSAEDMAWAQETCTAEIATLNATGLPIWNGSDVAVPREYLTPLSRRIGLAIAPSFGLVDAASAANAMREAERSLVLLADPKGGKLKPLRADDSTGGRSTFNFYTGL
jgi:hypothetical protein